MEPLNLHQLSLILDQALIIIPGESQKYQLTENFKARQGHPVVMDSNETDNSLGDPRGFPLPKEELEQETIKITYEGNYDKGVLIIYQDAELEAGSREFLMKIMAAVGCSLKDVALMSALRLQEFPQESFNHLNPHKCLVFGAINHPLMQFKREDYEIISGEILFLFADDLKEIAESIPLKKKLWASLQILFNINK